MSPSSFYDNSIFLLLNSVTLENGGLSIPSFRTALSFTGEWPRFTSFLSPKKLCRYLRSLPKGWLFCIMQEEPAWHRFWRTDLRRSRFLFTCTNVGFHPHQCTARGTHCSIKTHRPSHVPSCNTLTVATPSSIITVLKKKKKKSLVVGFALLYMLFPLDPLLQGALF